MHRINIGAIISRLDCLHRILVKLDVDQDIRVNLLVVLLRTVPTNTEVFLCDL